MVLGVAIWSLICCVDVLFLGFHCSLCSLGMCDGYLLPGRESVCRSGWQRGTEVGREKRTEKGFKKELRVACSHLEVWSPGAGGVIG